MTTAAPSIMSERMRITCPESGHLETVEVERTPVGLVVVGCSTEPLGNRISCTRECTRRMDICERGEGDRVLIIVEGLDGRHGELACRLAEQLRAERITVDIARAPDAPPLADYDGVVLLGDTRLHRRPRWLAHFVRARREELASVPYIVFDVGRRTVTDHAVRKLAEAVGDALPPRD